MPIQFSDLTSQNFEDLCFEYTKKMFSKENYKLEHTRYTHDGGKDIEVLFYDQLSHIKIWAECKHHKRAIGLEELGKNVVLVIAKQVNKILFFSSSEIRQSAQVTINKIGNTFNFDVSYLHGNKLMQQIKKYPDLVEKYFHQPVPKESPDEELFIQFAIAEQESDILIPIDLNQKSVPLKKGRIFNLYVLLGNYTNTLFKNVHILIENCPKELLFINTLSKFDIFSPNTDRQIELKGEIINRRNPIISSLEICISWEVLGGERERHTYMLPQLDMTLCKNYPLIGRSVNEFLANNVSEAISWAQRGYPQILSVYGSSGVGKSRLAEEIETKTREHGYGYIWMNGVDYDECDIIRFLFYNLLQLPLRSGKINFEKADIRDLIIQKSGSHSFAEMLADLLLDGIWEKKNMHYLVDAFVHFFLHPVGGHDLCIILDNLQRQNSLVIHFLTNVISVIENLSGKVILVIITNTEIIPALNQAAVADFLDYLEEKHTKKKLQHYLCPPLTEMDRSLFLIQLLHINIKDEKILSCFLEKTGATPFEIVMMLEYLGENKIIEWTSESNWHIKNLDVFMEFLKSCPKPATTILSARLSQRQKTFSNYQLSVFKEIVASILCFRGFIPYPYLYKYITDNYVINELQKTLWIMDAPSGKGLRFFHDNIYRFFASIPAYAKDAPIIFKILSWLKENPDIEVDKREKITFYGLYNTGKLSQAKEYGILLLKEFYKQKRYTDGIDIGVTLFSDLTIRQNDLDYVRIGTLYAANLFAMQDKDLASEIFRAIFPILLKFRSEIGLQELCETLHIAINTQLQTAHYKSALEFVVTLKELHKKSKTYKFIAENREGVTLLCMGEFRKAEKCFQESLETAYEMQNDYWISTTNSDMALLSFYDWTIANHSTRRQKTLTAFEVAINNYYKCETRDNQRDIEMAWHQIFVELLREEYSSALKLAEIGMEQSEKDNQLYGYIRALNLQGVAYLHKREFENAVSILQRGKHICEINRFSSGLFRMHNNLGVAYYLLDEMDEALTEFKLAKATEDFAEIEIKQQPVLANLLLMYHLKKDHEGKQNIIRQCDGLNSSALKQYKRALYNEDKFDFSFWTFNNANYIF